MKSRIIICVLLLLAASQSHAQSAAPPASTPAVPGVREVLDVPYVTNGHVRQRLDLYLPGVPEEEPRPVLVLIHGGAWRNGDKRSQRSVANYVSQGYIGVAINYRLSQHAVFPAQIEDCKAAIRWLRAHAQEYGIDPDRIGVMGSSAGGHLAALLGTTGDADVCDVKENLEYSSAVCAVVDNFGPTDFLQNLQIDDRDWRMLAVAQLLGGSISAKADLAAQANPITHISAGDPPFLIFHGDADPVVPQSQSDALSAALEKAHVPCEYHIVKGGAHGGEAFKSPFCKSALQEFLERNVKGAANVNGGSVGRNER